MSNRQQQVCYAFRLQPGREMKAHEAMAEAGISSLFVHQIEQVKVRRSHRIVVDREIVRPMFTGYGLAYKGADIAVDMWERHIRSLHYYAGPQKGHLSYVRSWLGPIVSGQGQLDALRATGGLLVIEQSKQPTRPLIKAGEIARIIGGPFARNAPILIEAVTDTKARVTIGQLRVSVPLELMEAA